MRKKIFIPCIIILAVCLWLLWPTHHQNIEPHKQITATNAEIQQAQTQNMEIHQISTVTNSSVKEVQQTTNLPRRGAQPPTPEEIYHMYDPWRTPIEFYGLVVDQSNNPVADATITFDCNDLSEKGTSFYERKSDVNGMFSLTGIRGEGITVHVSRKGYYTSKNDRDNFEYGQGGRYQFAPNLGNPVVFHLRKKGVGADLVGMKQNYRVARDGTPLGIDLATGKATTGGSGDFVVQCWTDDQGKTSGQKYDWHCVVTVPGGGVVPTDEEFPFQAPENGYVPTNGIAMPADGTNWTSDVDLKFYYRLADGRYGRMTFSMIAGGQHFCMIDSVLNPSGSRNLEPQ